MKKRDIFLIILRCVIALTLFAVAIIYYDELSNLDVRALADVTDKLPVLIAMILAVYIIKALVFVVPASVEKIGTYAFYGCTSLTSIEFKCEEDAYAGNSILFGCTSLQNVTLWNGLKTVDIYFFGECTSLVSVVLPGTVTKISSNVFYLCESLESIYFAGTSEEWESVEIKDKTEHLLAATVYFYSEEEPTEEGNYWHYSESGDVVVW